jgi:hypothetical protein
MHHKDQSIQDQRNSWYNEFYILQDYMTINASTGYLNAF